MATNFIPKIVYGSTTLTFTYPPALDPFSEEIVGVGKETISANGTEQYSENYQREIYSIKFKNLSKTELDAFRTFLKTWAFLGKEFNYYPHASEAGFEAYTIHKKQAKIKRTSPDSGDFRYSVDIKIRRVL